MTARGGMAERLRAASAVSRKKTDVEGTAQGRGGGERTWTNKQTTENLGEKITRHQKGNEL